MTDDNIIFEVFDLYDKMFEEGILMHIQWYPWHMTKGYANDAKRL